MSLNYGSDSKTALQAKFDAQKIAFAPIMFQAARALRNLGILELIKKKKKGIILDDIANELNLSKYGVKVLLEAGLSLEMLRVEDDKWFLTKTGFFLLSDELTKVNMDFTHDVNYLGMFKLEESIVSGNPEGLKVFGKWDTIYEALAELPPHIQQSWFEFDHYYSDNAFPEIMEIIFKDDPKQILDIGGNTGKFSIKCASYNPEIKLTILDLPGQLKKAYRNIEKAGYTERINGYEINLLDHHIDFPKGADAIWMSQFLDCFSQKDILELLKRSVSAMHNDSSLYILETYWDKQKFEASTYSLHATSLYFTCLANGCSQMYHSEDMLAIIKEAGLIVEASYENIGVSHTLFKCKKA